MVDRLLMHANAAHHHHIHMAAQVNPHHHHHHASSFSRKKKVKRLSSASQLVQNSAASTTTTTASAYYPSAYITNPCDQLFGPPQLFDCSGDGGASKQEAPPSSLDTSKTSQSDRSFLANSSLIGEHATVAVAAEDQASSIDGLENVSLHSVDLAHNNSSGTHDRFDYIPTPKWTKIQNSILEELFKKSRYPKSNELKTLAQRFHVMDSDIEVCF